MDPTDLASLNEILDWIQAMGLDDGPTSIYDRIGIREDDREIYTPLASHLVAFVEELNEEQGQVAPPQHHAPIVSSEADLDSKGSPERDSFAGQRIEPTSPPKRKLAPETSSVKPVLA